MRIEIGDSGYSNPKPLFGPVLTLYKAGSRQYSDLSSIHAAFREFSIAVRVARLRMARREGEMDRYCDVCSGYNESRNDLKLF
jgi:hypothetical protein